MSRIRVAGIRAPLAPLSPVPHRGSVQSVPGNCWCRGPRSTCTRGTQPVPPPLAESLGPYDVIIHNAGVGGNGDHTVTDDGLEQIFHINVVAPYLHTSLMALALRMIYLMSGLEENARWRTVP